MLAYAPLSFDIIFRKATTLFLVLLIYVFLVKQSVIFSPFPSLSPIPASSALSEHLSMWCRSQLRRLLFHLLCPAKGREGGREREAGSGGVETGRRRCGGYKRRDT